MSARILVRTFAFACALSSLAPRVRAEDPAPSAPPPVDAADAAARKMTPVTTATSARAWAQGVPEHEQQRARALFVEGNTLLKESYFRQAAAKYQDALGHWDHPGIHYNLALALINLDRPIEVREHLLKALRFGAAPLDEDKFNHAQSYLKLIEQQLAPLEISCTMDGAVVNLDDKLLFRAPGRYEGFVRPGEHRVRATKPGYVTTELNKTMIPGRLTKLDLELHTEEELTRYKRRWPVWGPIAVTAGGVVLGVTGGLLLAKSKQDFEDYDASIDRSPDCADDGCMPSNSQKSTLDRAETLRTAGGITLGVGAAALVTGTVLLFMNSAVPYRVDPGTEQARRRFELEPVVDGHFAGLRAAGTL